VLRPGEPQTDKILEASFDKLFFDSARYDLSSVGRMMINSSLNEDVALDTTILTIEDILLVVEKLLSIKSGVGKVDDIDSLANRRVRTAGELMENQFRVGLVRMERIIMERMSALDIESIMPNDLVSSKALTSVIRDFIGGAQLSQFMDQTNPLSEITHKRRLSSLGVGGLSRDRAGFEARDIHPSHYGRICPVETPEGPNIGLINSLSSYARLNDFGFIETPFKKVKDGQVSEDVEYLSTIDERGKVIAQADTIDPATTSFKYQVVSCRANEDFIISSPQEINYADVSARQLVSVASSLIPFLENDDANRALMGSNMMRQAVPLVQADAPLVGTGMEKIVARDSGAVVIAKRSGVVARVDASKIVIEAEVAEGDNIPVDIYKLRKFERTNQNTCINQKPIVAVGDIVKEGDIIADGSSIKNGELALGKNVMVAFMPWNGYNFEDSILISERLVSEDVFTSIHIEQFEVVARDTKLGPEEITRDIPNVSEDKMMNLDEMGIVRIGAKVKAGDILVGKVTPKSESPLTPEEKLLRAIFGEKAHEVRDTSLRVKLGIVGTVTDVKIFTRRGLDKDERALLIENIATKKARAERNERYKVMVSPIVKSIVKILSGQVLKSDFETLQEGDEVTEDFITSTPVAKLFNLPIDKSVRGKLSDIKQAYDDLLANLEADLEKETAKIQDDPILPSSVLKTIKVSVAVKRKLKPGDKMAGRHGNKGVISKIRAVEDMPYFEDGTPVDIVLNPLGVPSRMNVGQIMETHLGWASVELGKQVSAMLSSLKKGDITQEQLKQKLCDDIYPRQEQKEYIQNLDQEGLIKFAGLLENGVSFANPVFDGPKSEEITQLLQKAGCCETGQVQLYDGLSGEPFARKVTVGMIYMLKLHHLVDEKMHARSVGPYSLITQQPLGGKSHFGGQRFGEMECWALQAYGAAHSLQEMLTYKSDDMIGRVKIYNTLVKGVSNFESGIPESFNVMVKEMRSLCLNLELKQ
jgi:DNA-directed RNA polymerase subunit beta